MKLNGVAIPDDIDIPVLSAEERAEIDEVHEALHLHYEEMNDNATAPANAQTQVTTSAVTISLATLCKLPPLVRAKVLYVLREQVTD